MIRHWIKPTLENITPFVGGNVEWDRFDRDLITRILDHLEDADSFSSMTGNGYVRIYQGNRTLGVVGPGGFGLRPPAFALMPADVQAMGSEARGFSVSVNGYSWVPLQSRRGHASPGGGSAGDSTPEPACPNCNYVHAPAQKECW